MKTRIAANSSQTRKLKSMLRTGRDALLSMGPAESATLLIARIPLNAERVAPLFLDFRHALQQVRWAGDELLDLGQLLAAPWLDRRVQTILKARGSDLTRLRAHDEFHKQLGGIGVLGAFDDRGRSNDDYATITRVQDIDGVAFLLGFERGGGRPGSHRALAGPQHGQGVLDRAPDLRVVGLEFLEVVPPIERSQLPHPDADVAAEGRVA